MSPDQERRLEEIFNAARNLPPQERAAFLDRACAGDLVLRQEVESLLAAHAKAGDFLEHTIRLPASDFLIERTGTMIGRYKLLEKIGEGGFGVVYMAEQMEPVQRKVALKIIKPGMDSREVIARFEAERQALALMDHPNISRVLDGGATAAGRPYFVMELVRGIPITDYCDQKSLSTTERLRLFIHVCRAVQHAHQKGIIHRDVKPNNVLVTLHDGKPVPKVIDFGVAKALGQKLTEKTLFTGFAQMLGTPVYMSPEQAELSGLDIDTRSDIYSLGVLLYELLTGVTPFDKETLAKAALDEIRRLIRETEPPKPSTRLQTLGERVTEVAKHRHTEPVTLSRLVRGDLDWIVMKCLEKDRARRYETASALARDLQFHLEHKPVLAAAPTVGYRLSKFARRHQAIMLRSAAAFLIGVVAVTGVLWIVNGRGPRWLPEIRPRPRVVNTPPHIDFERGISDVYVQDHRVTAPGVRLLVCERYVFIRVKTGPGGWRAFDAVTRDLVKTHTQSVAYVVAPGGRRAFELAVDAHGLVCQLFPEGRPVRVAPAAAAQAGLGMLTAVPQVVQGLIVCALPAEGQLFGFDPESGRLAWTTRVTERIKGADPRIANVTADRDVVVAGLWGSRLWALGVTNGQHRWTRETCRYGRPIHALVAGSRVFGLAADENAYAFDKATGQRLWISRVGFCESAEHALVHGTNLVLWQTAGRDSDRSHVLAVSQADGRQQWQTPLLRNEPGALGCLGDFAVSAAGRILQRIDPRTGTAGAYFELPTLKRTVTLYGQEMPVFISHPLALAAPDTVYAFTVDGSLWCAHLPQSSTNRVLPSAEISQRSPEPAAEQLALTNRATPPLPAELKVWRAELEREGRTNVWTTLETKIDQVWAEAQEYARIVGGFPHIAIGRVVVPRGEDPRLVRAQMEVLEGGFFATSVRDLREPLSFRLPSCLPVDFPLKGHTGDLVFLSDVVLPAAAPQQMGSIHGRIRLDDGRDPGVAKVSAAIEMGPINHPSNGSEPSRYWPEPLTGRVDTNGEFLITGLSPAAHWVTVTAPGCLPVSRSVAVSSGQTNEMKQVLLERPLTLQLSWLLANKPEFGAATRLTESLSAGKDWKAKPHTYGHDLRFKQEGGRLFFQSFYLPCRLADLGLRQLDPTLSLDTGSLDFLDPQGEVLEGHVYLLRQEHFDPPYWVLFRVDAIGKPVAGVPTRPPVHTSAVSAQTDPLFTNVVSAIQPLRGRLREQTLGLDKLYNLLEPHLQELEDSQAEQLKEQQEAALAIQRVIPPRDPRAAAQLVNLSSNYNAAFSQNWHGDVKENNLAELPVGLCRFDGVEFDVHGIVQAPPAKSGTSPGALTNIVVQQACRRIHFLHAAIFAGGLTNLTEVGRYIVHFEQGPDLEIPLRIGVELADWWHTPGAPTPLAPEAWRGTNGKSRNNEGSHIRLFHLVWNNPRPGVAVRAIDLATVHEEARPFLIALTLE